jgi:hypothetical protein
MSIAEGEQMSLFHEYCDNEAASHLSHTDGLGALFAIALIVTPWVLLGWLVWLLA